MSVHLTIGKKTNYIFPSILLYHKFIVAKLKIKYQAKKIRETEFTM
jgi:hypothetical protein